MQVLPYAIGVIQVLAGAIYAYAYYTDPSAGYPPNIWRLSAVWVLVGLSNLAFAGVR